MVRQAVWLQVSAEQFLAFRGMKYTFWRLMCLGLRWLAVHGLGWHVTLDTMVLCR